MNELTSRIATVSHRSLFNHQNPTNHDHIARCRAILIISTHTPLQQQKLDVPTSFRTVSISHLDDISYIGHVATVTVDETLYISEFSITVFFLLRFFYWFIWKNTWKWFLFFIPRFPRKKTERK